MIKRFCEWYLGVRDPLSPLLEDQHNQECIEEIKGYDFVYHIYPRLKLVDWVLEWEKDGARKENILERNRQSNLYPTLNAARLQCTTIKWIKEKEKKKKKNGGGV